MNREHSIEYPVNTNRPASSDFNLPLLVGDAIHVLNREVQNALALRREAILAGLVKKQLAAGAEALAINMGPGREMGRLTPWVVQTIRHHTDRPLFFSANILAHKQVLKEYGQGLIINAVTAGEDLAGAMTTAKKYDCSLVVLLVRPGLVMTGIDDRIMLAAQVLETAEQNGFPTDSLYLDPVMSCRPDPAAWQVSRGLPDVTSVIETVGLIRQLDPDVKTIVAAGNGTEGMTREKKGAFQQRMLLLCAGAGVDAVLLNCAWLNGQWIDDALALSGSINRDRCDLSMDTRSIS